MKHKRKRPKRKKKPGVIAGVTRTGQKGAAVVTEARWIQLLTERMRRTIERYFDYELPIDYYQPKTLGAGKYLVKVQVDLAGSAQGSNVILLVEYETERRQGRRFELIQPNTMHIQTPDGQYLVRFARKEVRGAFVAFIADIHNSEPPLETRTFWGKLVNNKK